MFIEYPIPHKLNGRLQKYRLAEKGRCRSDRTRQMKLVQLTFPNVRSFKDELAVDAQRDEPIGRIEKESRQRHSLAPLLTFP